MSFPRSPGWIGAILGFLGVAAGAFGAHALRARLEPGLLAAFETGARMLLIHAVALVALEAVPEARSGRALRLGAMLLAAGSVTFAGSLFALALTGARLWGAVTPVGGLLLLAGWIALAAGLARGPSPRLER